MTQKFIITIINSSHPRRRSASINLHHGGDPAGLTPSLTITGIEPALTIIVHFISI